MNRPIREGLWSDSLPDPLISLLTSDVRVMRTLYVAVNILVVIKLYIHLSYVCEFVSNYWYWLLFIRLINSSSNVLDPQCIEIPFHANEAIEKYFPCSQKVIPFQFVCTKASSNRTAAQELLCKRLHYEGSATLYSPGGLKSGRKNAKILRFSLSLLQWREKFSFSLKVFSCHHLYRIRSSAIAMRWIGF